VIGQETGVLYQYETSTGIKWKTFGNEKLQPKYEGEIKNGKPNGFGFMTYPYDGKSVVGEWKNGKEWNTKHRKKDGTLLGMYVKGKWRKDFVLFGRRGESGKWGYFEDGDEETDYIYVGEIKNGKPDGQGTETYSDGDGKYVGEFEDGEKRNGIRYDINGNIIGKYVNGQWIKQ